MDREKLAKASFDFVLSENKYPESACGYLQEVFKRGADWLMQQPLSERLTEEEKEKIKGFYKDSELLELYGVLPSDRVAGRNLCLLLTDIFGADLFNQPTAI